MAQPAHMRYTTQYTRDQLAGKREPQRDMTNKVQTQRASRVRAAKKRKAKEQK